MIYEPTGCPIIYPPRMGLRLRRRARLAASRHAFEERLARLDPLLWAPRPVAAKPEPPAIYREYRAANRPFRRAFGGGEMRRKVLMAVGHRNAERKEAQS